MISSINQPSSQRLFFGSLQGPGLLERPQEDRQLSTLVIPPWWLQKSRDHHPGMYFKKTVNNGINMDKLTNLNWWVWRSSEPSRVWWLGDAAPGRIRELTCGRFPPSYGTPKVTRKSLRGVTGNHTSRDPTQSHLAFPFPIFPLLIFTFTDLLLFFAFRDFVIIVILKLRKSEVSQRNFLWLNFSLHLWWSCWQAQAKHWEGGQASPDTSPKSRFSPGV